MQFCIHSLVTYVDMYYIYDIACSSNMKQYRNVALASTYIGILAPKWKENVKKWCFGQLSNMLKDEKCVLVHSTVNELAKCSSEDLEVRRGVYINLRTKTPSLFHQPSGPFEFKHRRIETDTKCRNKFLTHFRSKAIHESIWNNF